MDKQMWNWYLLRRRGSYPWSKLEIDSWYLYAWNCGLTTIKSYSLAVLGELLARKRVEKPAQLHHLQLLPPSFINKSHFFGGGSFGSRFLEPPPSPKKQKGEWLPQIVHAHGNWQFSHHFPLQTSSSKCSFTRKSNPQLNGHSSFSLIT